MTNEKADDKAVKCCEQDAGKASQGTKEKRDKAFVPVAANRIYKITGMDCIEEVTTLKRAIGPLVGGEGNLTFDVLNGRMGVKSDHVTDKEIQDVVAGTGMTAAPLTDEQGGAEPSSHRTRASLLTFLSGLLVLSGFCLDAWHKGSFLSAFKEEGGLSYWSMTAYSAAILSGSWFVVPKALYALRNLRADMNLLMTVAVLGAVGIGEWFEAATVTFLFSLSLALEAWSVSRARNEIKALMSLAPDTVRIKRKGTGQDVEVPAEQVSVGEIFVVLGGERIPLDGEVVRGVSQVNQAPITGESMPVEKQLGDAVFAGTVNGDGTLEIEATKTAGDTTLANIIRLVGEAQSKRAPSEQWVEKFARVYTPCVIFLAAITFIIPALMGLPASEWFYKALVLLVIACPCALVISTPVSIVSSLTAAARAGVLIKGGMYIETPARLKALALDKTGTITEGKPSVVEIIPLSGHDETELLERAAAMEARSSHPLAVAIVEYAQSKKANIQSADNVVIVPGKGVTGTFEGKLFWLGSDRYLQERGQETEDVKDKIEKLGGVGRSIVAIGNETHLCGLIALVDAIRPQAIKALKGLKESGIEHLVMLSGDNSATAEYIAAKVGIDEVKAELLPDDKVRAIEELVSRYEFVGMLGDGVNDAPAMGRASLGIAMGAVGSDAAIESADIALMTDDLSRLPWLVKHSRRTLSIVKQNIALSLMTKIVFIVLSIAGLSTLWVAIAADMGTTFVVILNGLRLLHSADEYRMADD